MTCKANQMAEVDEEFINEAIRCAEAVGIFPAQAQRAVDWEAVRAWANRVRQPGFCWQAGDGWNVDAIIVGPGPNGTRAIHSGQHRVLGGLMGGNPVPICCMLHIDAWDRTRGWAEATHEIDVLDLLFAQRF